MTDAATSLEWSFDSPLQIVAALLLFVLVLGSALAAWRRLGANSRARWAGVALLNATAGLAILALLVPPVVPGPASDAVTLITEGARSGPAPGAATYVAPGAGDFGRGPEYLLDAGQLPFREPALGTLTVQGFGLDARQWRSLPGDLIVRYDPPPLSGLVAASWERSLREGEALIVTGRYLEGGAVDATSLELVDPAGMIVAVHDLSAGVEFELITLPKAPGLLDYRLRVVDDGAEVQSERVPVHVSSGQRPVLYVLQSAPSFETRQLQNWAGDNGATVVIDTVITRGRELRQRVNAGELADDRLSPSLLEATGLAVVDGRTWAGFDTGRRAWFEAAVRDGMGLLILADGELARYLADSDTLLQGVGLTERERNPDGYVPAWEGSVSEQQLPLAGLALESGDAVPLTRIDSGEVIEVYRNVGLGRVAVSVLRERHRWLTSGDDATYTAYWARLMSRIGRPAPLPFFLPAAGENWPRPQQRMRLCALTRSNDVSFEVAPLYAETSLELDTAGASTGGARRCAEFWPWQAGWHRARLYAGDGGEPLSEAFFFAFGDDQWQTLERFERRQATLRRAEPFEPDQAAMTRTARVEIDPLWAWLVFVISAGLLWLERRLY